MVTQISNWTACIEVSWHRNTVSSFRFRPLRRFMTVFNAPNCNRNAGTRPISAQQAFDSCTVLQCYSKCFHCHFWKQARVTKNREKKTVIPPPPPTMDFILLNFITRIKFGDSFHIVSHSFSTSPFRHTQGDVSNTALHLAKMLSLDWQNLGRGFTSKKIESFLSNQQLYIYMGLGWRSG
jgi:hypothetical protein